MCFLLGQFQFVGHFFEFSRIVVKLGEMEVMGEWEGRKVLGAECWVLNAEC
jgi:hypothetical protein